MISQARLGLSFEADSYALHQIKYRELGAARVIRVHHRRTW